MSVTIWHNPRCSKSRATLELLQQQNIEPVIVEYLQNPPTVDELSAVLTLLGSSPRDFMRSGQSEYAENGLDDESLSDAALLAAMIENPILIERPVVLANGKAAVGRPPESVLEIL